MPNEVNGVQFDEPEGARGYGGSHIGGGRFMYAKVVASDEPPAIIKWLLENKIVGSEQQAVNAVLIVIILIILGAGYFFFFSSPKTQIQYANEIQQRESDLTATQ